MRNVMMAKGAGTVVNRCAQVKAGETVLIVTEASRMSIAECLAEAVCAAGAQPVLSVILPRERDGQEPPECVAAAMKIGVSNGIVSGCSGRISGGHRQDVALPVFGLSVH